MKLHGLDDEIVVDDLPSTFKPNQKVFLTTLVCMEKRTIPTILPNIYTSEILKTQFVQFLKSKSIECDHSSFHILKPFVPETITLSNGTIYEVLPCCPQGTSTNMFLVFRIGPVITHVYVGVCSDLRSIVLNKTVLSWLRRDSRADMYIPVNNPKECIECEFRRAVVAMEDKANVESTAKVLIQLPLFGFEAFIARIAWEFRDSVALYGVIEQLYMQLPTDDKHFFAEDVNSARIIITGGDRNKEFSENIKLKKGTLTDKSAIEWSPLASLNELNLLIKLFRPKKMYGISLKFTNAVQVFSVCYDSSESPDGLFVEFMQRQSVNIMHCCLEKHQALYKRVIEGVQCIIDSRKPENSDELSQQENSTAESATTSNRLKNQSINKENTTPSTRVDKENSAANIDVRSKEHTEKQMIDLVESSTDSDSPIETVAEDEITKNTEQAAKKHCPNQPETNQRKSSPSVDVTPKRQPEKLLQTKDGEDQIVQKSPCPPMTSLVYRKGKKGITFVDEDSD